MTGLRNSLSVDMATHTEATMATTTDYMKISTAGITNRDTADTIISKSHR